MRSNVLMQCPPDCEVEMSDDDLIGQSEHMTASHPEIVAERRKHAARWDGWEDGDT